MWKITTILVLALILRLYGINWDLGFHLHPDERMLIIVADRIQFFNNLNPQFFNYGSLPIYLLKGIAQISDFFLFTHFSSYDGLLVLGRTLSTFIDLITLITIYKITLNLFKKENVALLASLLYGLAFFPIQNAHFFVVDVFLTCFATLLVYMILLHIQHPTLKTILRMGIIAAAAVATKVTAVLFLPVIGIVLLLHITQKITINSIPTLFRHASVFAGVFLLAFFLFMPYAFIAYDQFLKDILLQSKMSNDPYIFPYTLQYVSTLPYLYFLKNIFLWGLGPVTSILSVIGLVSLILHFKRHSGKQSASRIVTIVVLIFYIIYFLIIGRSAVKFMRYMLPLYPFFTIIAGYGLYYFSTRFAWSKNKLWFEPFTTLEGKLRREPNIFIVGLVLTACAIWTFAFMSIYTQPNTRIQATNWILQIVPPGSTLAIEHWDDRLPLIGNEQYQFQELTLYDTPDDEYKWNRMQQKLDTTDYIIIASNRLYTPLQRLVDCDRYRSCYPITANYYNNLFKENLGFKKVAEFTSYPHLKIGNWELKMNDDNADESFTVYDHPKIMIFKKNR